MDSIDSQKTCSVCNSSMNDCGQAIYTAECSHSFHLDCVSFHIVCPDCSVPWTQTPHFPNFPRLNPLAPRLHPYYTIPIYEPLHGDRYEPAFNDDEPLDHQSPPLERNSSSNTSSSEDKLKLKIYTEAPAVSKFSSPDNFTILINLRAPDVTGESSRVPVDIVTVLDVSYSMAGTKLELLKRAMGFVIQNLGPNDRLSVVIFSRSARRVFPLRRMTESGKKQALEAVNGLVVEPCTNIAAGLRLGAKVMEDRKFKNPVASVMFLSDGTDTEGFSNIHIHFNPIPVSDPRWTQPNYQLLLPPSIKNDKIPVHAFGFGSDHDASLMHSVSEISRGTFSFIETESVIQDAFAQCIGGLLSVVVKELQVNVECVDSRVRLGSLKAGSNPNQLTPDGRMGNINAGELYAEEERDFLVTVKVPIETSSSETTMLKVRCVYNDPLTKEVMTVRSEEVKIKRPEAVGQQEVCVKVDRQQSRLLVAEAMVQARDAAERGNLRSAASILGNCQKKLSESVAAKFGDTLCLALEAELKDMQEKVASRTRYEREGRAFMLSASSSHYQQRAAAGAVFGMRSAAGAAAGSCFAADASGAASRPQAYAANGPSFAPAYQTRAMSAMVNRSQQATQKGNPSTHRLNQSQTQRRR